MSLLFGKAEYNLERMGDNIFVFNLLPYVKQMYYEHQTDFICLEMGKLFLAFSWKKIALYIS